MALERLVWKEKQFQKSRFKEILPLNQTQTQDLGLRIGVLWGRGAVLSHKEGFSLVWEQKNSSKILFPAGRFEGKANLGDRVLKKL